MRYVEDSLTIELSVDELCERVFRSGNMDRKNAPRNMRLIGSETYRKIQSGAGAFYNSEVELSTTFAHNGLYYTVSGMADGIIKKDGIVTVDEIKSVGKFDFFAPPRDVFLAQMRCYAYFVASRDELDVVYGRLTYVNSENGKIKYFNYEYRTEDLRAWYKKLIEKISRAAEFMKYRQEILLPSAEGARFPYPELREGQEIMIRESYRAMKKGERLFVEAPTGTGKTISSLYPAIRAIGAGYADKIFYLTAKSSTRREAYRAAGKLFEAGARLRTVVITAKEQLCLCGARITGANENLCDPKICDFACGYYDRVDDAVFELLSRQNGFTRQIIAEVAKKYRVCPYELSLDLSEYCDIIICDYNYIFDPMVYFRRYFGSDADVGKYIFLIDESHNLADRARDMYSATLHRSEFERLYAQIPLNDNEFNKAFERIIIYLRGLRRLCRDNMVRTSDGEERGFYMNSALPEKLLEELRIFKSTLDDWLRHNPDDLRASSFEKLVMLIRRYLAIGEYFDERFLFYIEISGGDMMLKIYCLDPSHIMDTLQNRAVSTVLFSATLRPADYFVDVLGGVGHSRQISLPSPFDRDALGVMVADYLSLRYGDREKNTKKYATVIAATVSAKAGNYMVYFPSYEMLKSVSGAFCAKYPNVKTIIQKQNMTLREKEEFLDEFKEDRGVLRIGFCVLGGAFSEGVDLPGNRLIGVVIFGVGLPGLSNENNIIRDYFEPRNGCGYDYAYTYPGMNNVLQAAGRVIRRDEDEGVVVLVDDRYAEEKYRNLFPEHWKNVKYARNAQSLAESVADFWKK